MRTTKVPVPIEAVDESTGIYGMSGSGKSYVARLLTEANFSKSDPTCMIDPKGDGWGIRLDADGKGPGLPFKIIGGPHADEGLEIPEEHPEAFATPLAEMFAKSRDSILIDLSSLGPVAMRRFVAAFVQGLYQLRRDPYTLVIDEADEFAPNLTGGGGGDVTKCLSVVARMAKRGRGRGCRLWIVSQRPSSISTDVRGQMQTLAVNKLTLPHDLKAVGDWMKGHDPAQAAEIVASITGLRDGKRAEEEGRGTEGWFWSTGLKLVKRVEWTQIATYDSMRTPKRGERRADIAPTPIDTGELRKALAERIEEIKANDPKTLRAEIEELRNQLAEAQAVDAHQEAETDQAALEAAFEQGKAAGVEIGERSGRAVGGWEATRSLTKQLLGGAFCELAEKAASLNESIERHAEEVRGIGNNGDAPPVTKSERITQALAPMKIRSIKFNTADLPAPKGDRSFIPDKTEGAKPVRCIVEHEGKRWELDPRHLRILQAVYQLAARLRKAPTRQQIGAILGVRFDAGTFKVDLGRLRSAGLVDYPTPGEVIATEKGSALVPKESASRLNLWTGIQKVLDPRHVRILEVVKASRGPVTREQIGKALGINHTAGTFKVDLGKLRTLGLVEYPSSGLVEVTSWVRGLA